MKRAIDILFASLSLVVLSPVILIVGILVRWRLGSPVLFFQERAGLHGQSFILIKFRSMLTDVGGSGASQSDASRLTRFGACLRATSLDELPEFWNVLRGDMSLIGPRPLLPEYLPLYSEHQSRRHEVQPGLTGWAQVNGRNDLSWDERFDLDVWYVDNHSLWLDLRIAAITVLQVLRRDGITAAGEVSMPKFTGSKPRVCQPGAMNDAALKRVRKS